MRARARRGSVSQPIQDGAAGRQLDRAANLACALHVGRLEARVGQHRVHQRAAVQDAVHLRRGRQAGVSGTGAGAGRVPAWRAARTRLRPGPDWAPRGRRAPSLHAAATPPGSARESSSDRGGGRAGGRAGGFVAGWLSGFGRHLGVVGRARRVRASAAALAVARGRHGGAVGHQAVLEQVGPHLRGAVRRGARRPRARGGAGRRRAFSASGSLASCFSRTRQRTLDLVLVSSACSRCPPRKPCAQRSSVHTPHARTAQARPAAYRGAREQHDGGLRH